MALLRPYLLGGAVIALLASHGAAWWHGHSRARVACEASALRSEIETLRRDLDVARKASDRAARMAEQQAAEAADLTARMMDYEAELAARGDDAGCRLDGRDVERLRAIGAPAR